MKSIGIIGGTGYTGVELLRILGGHPEVAVTHITSRERAGAPVTELFPALRGVTELVYSDPVEADLGGCDLVFGATPHGVAMEHAPRLLEAGVVLLDLSADFRIKDAALWERWYGRPHACPELLAEAVYGLPETNREVLRGARLVAVPGCYPTAVQLGFLPLLEQKLVDPAHLIADAKSGVSGAGRQAGAAFGYGEIADSFKAYKVPGHRHAPEIVQQLRIAAGGEVGLTFVPHLAPMIRGIHATLYAHLNSNAVDLQALYEDRYRDEPFVDVMPAGSHPDTRSVRGANVCRLACHRPGDGDTVVVLAVEDNLVKGAAGQAVQVMNIVFGFDETLGLEAPGLVP